MNDSELESWREYNKSIDIRKLLKELYEHLLEEEEMGLNSFSRIEIQNEHT